MMRIQIITLFPDMFNGVLASSMLYKASQRNIVNYKLVPLRDFGLGPRKQVDDTPYGGGDGMLLRVDTLVSAIEAAKADSPEAIVILPTPRGDFFRQSDAKAIAGSQKDLIIICPRYEG